MKKSIEPHSQAHTDRAGKPRFGLLLIVLIFTVFLLAVITWASETYLA